MLHVPRTSHFKMSNEAIIYRWCGWAFRDLNSVSVSSLVLKIACGCQVSIHHHCLVLLSWCGLPVPCSQW